MEVLREVVDPHEVQPVDAEALQALLDRLQHTVLRVVVDDAVGPAELEDTALLAEVPASRLDLVQDQPADLGAEYVFVALMRGERFAQADLGQPGAVERRCVVIARALLPGSIDRRGRFLVWNIAEHIAQRRSTEAQWAVQQSVANPHDSLHRKKDQT